MTEAADFPRLLRDDFLPVWKTLAEILQSGDHAIVEIEIVNGYVKRFEVNTLDRAGRRTENLSVGEEPSSA